MTTPNGRRLPLQYEVRVWREPPPPSPPPSREVRAHATSEAEQRRAAYGVLVASAIKATGCVPAWAIHHPLAQQALTAAASARPTATICERHGPTGTKVCKPCVDALDEAIEW